MGYVRRGELLGAEVGTVDIDDVYYVRIEATPAISALIHATGWFAIYVTPAEDSGRAWYQIPYTDELDMAIQDLVDVLADVRFNKPNFGQMRLFGEEHHA